MNILHLFSVCQMQQVGSKSSRDLRIIKMASSYSTIYINDSTMISAIYYHIKNRISNQVQDIFDEKLHPLTVSEIK